MILRQTELQVATSHFPTQHDFYRILYYRGSSYFSKEKKMYHTLKAGAEGEKIVLQLLEKFGHNDWIVLRNIWMNKSGDFESDIILITHYYVYIFEIKHYKKKFTYKNGVCYYGNNEMPRNGIQQARRNHVYLKNICAGIVSSENVRAAILFTGKNCEVDIKTPIDYLEIKDRTQIEEFFETIVEEEMNMSGQPIDADRLIKRFEQYEMLNPYAPKPLTQDEMKEIHGGIYCARCQRYKLISDRYYVKCDCGLHESREESTIRTICDYGVLTFGHPMTRKKLLDFFNKQVSKNLLVKTLHQHFKINKNGSHTTIDNKNLLYDDIQDEFIVERPKILYTKNIHYIEETSS